MWVLIVGGALILCCIGSLIFMLVMLWNVNKQQKEKEDSFETYGSPVVPAAIDTTQMSSYPSYDESRQAQTNDAVNFYFDATSVKSASSPQALEVPQQQNDLENGMHVSNENCRDSIFDPDMDNIDKDVDEYQYYESDSFDESTGSD